MTRGIESWMPVSVTGVALLPCKQARSRKIPLYNHSETRKVVKSTTGCFERERAREREETARDSERQQETARGTRLCLSIFVKRQKQSKAQAFVATYV